MLMAEATKVWTLDELHSLPDDGNKYELVHGELFVTPAPSLNHETIGARLTRLLDPYVEAHGLGYVLHPRSVIQFAGSEVEPDLMVRQAPNPNVAWDEVPIPRLVVEILSPSTRRRDREHKREFYLEIGVQDYWIVDPEQRSIVSVRAGRADVVSTAQITWEPEGVAVPLVLDVPKVFGM